MFRRIEGRTRTGLGEGIQTFLHLKRSGDGSADVKVREGVSNLPSSEEARKGEGDSTVVMTTAANDDQSSGSSGGSTNSDQLPLSQIFRVRGGETTPPCASLVSAAGEEVPDPLPVWSRIAGAGGRVANLSHTPSIGKDLAFDPIHKGLKTYTSNCDQKATNECVREDKKSSEHTCHGEPNEAAELGCDELLEVTENMHSFK